MDARIGTHFPRLVCPLPYVACPWLAVSGVQHLAPTANLLLAAFSPEARAAVVERARTEELQIEQRLFGPSQRNDVFFPLDCVISLIQNLADGSSAEVGMVGPEGMLGINAMAGVARNPQEGLTQGRGVALRLGASDMRDITTRFADARDVLLRYTYAHVAMLSQLAACNRLHPVTQRLAHWLLLMRDRVGADEMSLTQDFLSRMLASRRAGISEAVSTLEKAGAIEHRRVRVRVIDRAKLEAAACECYANNVRDYRDALGFDPVARGRSSPVD
jgi:CRP-like cAMP-binding protein